jgi:3-oxoacyl-[acyl-carrier-protein] synthase III
MIGIKNIAKYIPESRVSNIDLAEKFGFNEQFLDDKIGVLEVSRMGADEKTSDLAVKAFNALKVKCGFTSDEIDCLVVVTQNPDYSLPHTSAVVHGKLALSNNCACFDISLGCSGYTYALSVVKTFMESNELTMGVLITADPYSGIIDPDDKNTTLLFGDASTATLLSTNPLFNIMKFTFGTSGKDYPSLINNNDTLYMNGRAIFNFVARNVPKDVKNVLRKNEIDIQEVDTFVFHQGSKFVVNTIIKKLGIDPNKAPFMIRNYGNTVSSSIPILLENLLTNPKAKILLLSGFGVGLSWSSVILKRNKV